MLEKLFSLAFPPGLVNSGTTYQSKGRWHLANAVRFFQGTIQPVGGWSARSLTGATITGTPHAMVSWEGKDQLQWIAVGTTTGLFLISQSTGVVYNITPTNLSVSQPYDWDLQTFGQSLIAVMGVTYQITGALSDPVTVYSWSTNPSAPATAIGNSTSAPQSSYAAVVTPERFAVLLRGADPGDYARDATWTD